MRARRLYSLHGSALLLSTFLAVMFLLAVGIVEAQGEQHYVVLSTDNEFSWSLRGYLEFVYENPGNESGYIYTDSGFIEITPGSVVRIVVNSTDQGYIWMDVDSGSSGRWIDIGDALHVDAIYVNGELAASDTYITGVDTLRYAPSSINSTLKLMVMLQPWADWGWASLEVDGETLIDQWDYEGYFIIYNIKPGSNTELNLNLGGHWLSAVAEGVEYLGQGDEAQVIGIDELPFLRAVISYLEG